MKERGERLPAFEFLERNQSFESAVFDIPPLETVSSETTLLQTSPTDFGSIKLL